MLESSTNVLTADLKHNNLTVSRVALQTLLTLLVGLMALFLSAGNAIAKAPFQARQSPGYFRLMVGAFEVTALYDGGAELPTALLHADRKLLSELLAKDFVDPDHVKGAVTGFLINTGEKLVLIDTGTGSNWGGPTLGKLAANLKLSGYKPDQIDLVLLTHLHADHAGGITDANGKRVFINADVQMTKADSAFWLSESVAAQATEDAKIFFSIARDVAKPYIKAGRWKPFEGTNEIVPGITPLPIPGHTPGHTGYAVESNGQQLLLWGDVVHVASAQLALPEIGIDFDVDGPTAVMTRGKLFETLSERGTLIGGAHMPFPSLGRLRKNGSSYVWLPASYIDLP